MSSKINHQPGIGRALLKWRTERDTPMSRAEVSAMTGFPPHKIVSIEDGRKLKEGEYERLVAAIPSLDVEEDETLIPQGPVTPPEVEFPELVLDTAASVLPESESLTGLRPVSNSEVQTFKQCRRKWWLEWHRKLRKRDELPIGALAIGTRIHRALEALYDPDNPTDPFDALERAVIEDWTVYSHATRERGLSIPPDVETRFQSDTALERIMLEGYIQWLAETGEDQFLEVTATETYLEAPLDIPSHNTRVRLIGKLDLRVRRTTDGARLFLDHKTVMSFNQALQMLHMNEQMLHYHLLEFLSQVEGGHCDGALYNMLRKVKRGKTSTPPYYMRQEIRHNQAELDSYRAKLTGVIGDILTVESTLLTGTDPNLIVYPSPSRDCTWKCPFVNVCHLFDDGSRAEEMIRDQFIEGEPLDRYMSKEERP